MSLKPQRETAARSGTGETAKMQSSSSASQPGSLRFEFFKALFMKCNNLSLKMQAARVSAAGINDSWFDIMGFSR